MDQEKKPTTVKELYDEMQRKQTERRFTDLVTYMRAVHSFLVMGDYSAATTLSYESLKQFDDDMRELHANLNKIRAESKCTCHKVGHMEKHLQEEYEDKQERIRQTFACDICGNWPDEDGQLEHGKGCYSIDCDEDGGGRSYIDPKNFTDSPCSCSPCNAHPFTSFRGSLFSCSLVQVAVMV